MSPRDNIIKQEQKLLDCRHCALKQFSAFQDCPDEILIEALGNKQVKKFTKGNVLFSQSTPFEGVYCIQEGTVKVSTFGNKRKEFILWFAKPGDILGADSFIRNTEHLFTATACAPVIACFVPAHDLRKLLSLDPSIAKRLIKILCEEISSIEGRISSVSQKSIREQFAEILLLLAAKENNNPQGNTTVNYSIKDLANTIGTTNNYLYKIISEFNDRNVVAIKNKKLVIKDFDKLSLIAIGEEAVT